MGVYAIGLAAFVAQTYIGMTTTTDQIVSKTSKSMDPAFSCESMAPPSKESGYNGFGYVTKGISSANPLICSQGNCFPCEMGYNFDVYNMLYANASACATETAARLSSFAGTATWETHSDPLAVGSFLWDVPGMARFRLELKARVAPAREDVVHVADAAVCVELLKSAEVFDLAVRDINITDSCTQYDIRGPFVCTQVLHVHQPILQVLGSSIANSQMVVAVLTVLSGYIIKFVASRTQDKDAGCSISPVPEKPN